MNARRIWENKNWLYSKYIVERKGTTTIAREAKCCEKTVFNWLHRYHFEIRDKATANVIRGLRIAGSKTKRVKLSITALQFLQGEILSDSHLARNSKWSAKINRHCKHLSYIEWFSSILESFGIKRAGKIRKRIGENFISYVYTSCSYAELHLLWDQWYRKGKKNEKFKFVKIVPKDFKLSSLTCRQWLIGDGHLNKRRKCIFLHTTAFTISEVYSLLQQLRNFKIYATYQNSCNSIRIPKQYTKSFLNFIGPCPKEIENIYGYKWNF